jgi:GNAT superfamily N-acetyltransferase
MRTTAVDAEAVRLLRAEVLRPGQPREQLIFPGDDEPDTLHAAVAVEGRIVGVASVMREPYPRGPLVGDWRIRGMATSAEMRGRGIGAALLARCKEHARDHAGARLWCNARVRARTLYERAGFAVDGDPFEIPMIGSHYLMRKPLRNQRG